MRQVIALSASINIDKTIFPEDYYRLVYVKYNISELELIKNKIDDMFLRLHGVGFVKTIGINVKKNTVELSVSSGNYQKAYDALSRAGLKSDAIELKIMDAEIRPLSNHYPGTKLMLADSYGGAATCTGGFVCYEFGYLPRAFDCRALL